MLVGFVHQYFVVAFKDNVVIVVHDAPTPVAVGTNTAGSDPADAIRGVIDARVVIVDDGS